jgi:hypothetical protein
MKIMVLAGLYLFFVRVLWSVYNELRDPRTRVQRRAEPVPPVTTAAAPNMRTTTRRGGAAVAAAPAPVASNAPVAVLIGQLMVLEPPENVGLTWALGNEITIGRAATCGLHIDDTYVSSVHARIFNRSGVFVIEDLDSRNGTVLNGNQLTTATELRPGDRIQFGTTLLEFS